MPADPIAWYERRAARWAAGNDALSPERPHAWLDGRLPAAPALVLDVGAGTGRDAARLAASFRRSQAVSI